MKNGTIYSAKAGGRKHYLQVILKKDLTGGSLPVVAIFRKHYVEWDKPSMEDVARGEILLVTHLAFPLSDEVFTKEGWAPASVSPARIVLKDGDNIHMPNGPTVPAALGGKGLSPFHGGPLAVNELVALLGENAKTSLKSLGELLPEPGEPLKIMRNRQVGFLIAGGMFFLVAAFNYVTDHNDGPVIAAILAGIGVIIASMYLFYKDRARDAMVLYPDHVEIFENDKYATMYFPFMWVRRMVKMKMVKGEGKYARVDQGIYMKFLGEDDSAPPRKKFSRYPQYDIERCLFSPLTGGNREENLDKIISLFEDFTSKEIYD